MTELDFRTTYASGKVVPSATLLLRMKNLADSGSARPKSAFASLT
jgi:hypothetical protein